jgi:WhiB family redox-sensing transcriptional regulator
VSAAGLLDGTDMAMPLDDRPAVELPCRSAPEDLWFSERPADLERAKALCTDCPVRRACLAGALARREFCGVWGGEILDRGSVIARKRPRDRPSKADLARDAELAAARAG